MSSSERQHLSCGALAAITQSASMTERGLKSHLDACPDCKRIYEKVRAFSKSQKGFDFEKQAKTLSKVCDETVSDFEKVDNFLAFLTSELSDEIATCHFHHVNHCLPCLIFFATNWSDYITVQNK